MDKIYYHFIDYPFVLFLTDYHLRFTHNFMSQRITRISAKWIYDSLCKLKNHVSFFLTKELDQQKRNQKKKILSLNWAISKAKALTFSFLTTSFHSTSNNILIDYACNVHSHTRNTPLECRCYCHKEATIHRRLFFSHCFCMFVHKRNLGL